MNYLTAYYTDQGKRKGINQDSLLVTRTEYEGQEVLLAAVCDGMGGLSKGEVASAEAIRSLEEWFRREFEALAGQEEFEDALYDSWEELFQNVHTRLLDYGQHLGTRVGTTLTAMLFREKHYYIAHVGDTRIYEIKDQAVQLTRDQVAAQLDAAYRKKEIGSSGGENTQEKGDAGKETECGKPEHGKGQHILLQGIGCAPVLRPVYYSGKVERDAVYLLCTDGFRHKLHRQEMREAFHSGNCRDEEKLSEQGRMLARLALDRGEKDNLTVILIRTLED